MDSSVVATALRGHERKLVILPIGSFEQHGPYLPVDTDLRIAQLLAEKLALSFSDSSILLPIVPFSCSFEHKGLGTIALNVSTFAVLLHDIAHSITTWDVPLLLILVNWHGGNDLLGALATEISAREGIPTAAIPSVAQVGNAWDESGITSAKDIHAGAIETSIIRAYWPELIKKSIPSTAHDEPDIAPAKVQSVLQSIGSLTVTREGIWGAPEDADAEKGKVLIEALVSKMHDQTAALLALVNKYTKERGFA